MKITHSTFGKYSFWAFVYLTLFLMTGCEEKSPVYSSFCDHNQSRVQIPCLHYMALDENDRKRMEIILGYPNRPDCPYRLELTKYQVKTCNNPVVKSVGSDFNGYVRIEIKKGFKCYYKIQSDYKHDVNAAFERVMKEAEKEIKKPISIN